MGSEQKSVRREGVGGKNTYGGTLLTINNEGGV